MAKNRKTPEWVNQFKKKGTQVTRQGENYYLYKIKTVWDKEKKTPKKITEGYLGKITPDGVIPPKHKRNNLDLVNLKVGDKTLKRLQIVKELRISKDKNDIAKRYNVTTKTISNIERRFEKEGIKGLIHTRESRYETVKISTPEQAAIITDIVQNPNKTAKEIKNTTVNKLSLSSIKKIITPITKYLKLKKKILLEIQ